MPLLVSVDLQQVRRARFTADSSACWLQLTWDQVHSANVEVMGESKSDYLEGVASGSLSFHWVIALALTTEQPFPGWLWRRADAAADSAQLPSLGLAAIS